MFVFLEFFEKLPQYAETLFSGIVLNFSDLFFSQQAEAVERLKK